MSDRLAFLAKKLSAAHWEFDNPKANMALQAAKGAALVGLGVAAAASYFLGAKE